MAACYEIQLKGHLDHDWSTWLNDFTITHQTDGSTKLVGFVLDQAALHGLLARIRDLSIPILIIKSLKTENRRIL